MPGAYASVFLKEYVVWVVGSDPMTILRARYGAVVLAAAMATGALGFPAVSAADPDAVPPAMLNTTCSLDQIMAATKVVDPIAYGEIVGKYNSESPWVQGEIVRHMNLLLEKTPDQRQAEVDELATSPTTWACSAPRSRRPMRWPRSARRSPRWIPRCGTRLLLLPRRWPRLNRLRSGTPASLRTPRRPRHLPVFSRPRRSPRRVSPRSHSVRVTFSVSLRRSSSAGSG
jgi:hypothetical protein